MRAYFRRWRFAFPLALAALLGGAAIAEEQFRKHDPELQRRVETALAQQAWLMGDAVKALAPQRPGVRDLYFLGYAGFGDQDVFRKEVERVRDLLDTKFGTSGRSMVLINHPETLAGQPLATLRNLAAALREIGKRMDPEEDVLFLFLTSHGQEKKGVVSRLNDRGLGPVTPARLADALRTAGINQRIVIVSACFSGQFVPALQSKDSLIITAAAHDRPSFGCSTDAEWTWFGESYFVEALPRTGKFVSAFTVAKRAVTEREKKVKETPSQPQISLGANMKKILGELGY